MIGFVRGVLDGLVRRTAGESWKRPGIGNFAFGAGVLFLLLLGCASGIFLSFGRVNGRVGGREGRGEGTSDLFSFFQAWRWWRDCFLGGVF